MMGHTLRLFTDRFAPGEAATILPAIRVLYVVEGSLNVRAAGISASLDPNSAWCGIGEFAVSAGKSGAKVLRWEVAADTNAPAARLGSHSTLSLAAPIVLPAPQVLLRCDRVEFPPGGEALTHVHQGPGIRCLLTGSIRIDSTGVSHTYGPGDAWFESGPEPVYAAASATESTAFVRVMILPRTCHSKSSIRYVRPEDVDKPKNQKYQIFADELISP